MGKIVVADGDKASLYYAKLAVSDDGDKKKKALKQLRHYKADSDGHWDNSRTRKSRKQAEAAGAASDADKEAEEAVKAALEEKTEGTETK